VHSEWFLDSVTPPSLVSHLPAVYQAALWPARVLFRLLGPERARALHETLDVPALILGKVSGSGWPIAGYGPLPLGSSQARRLVLVGWWQGIGGYARALLLACGFYMAHDSSAADSSHKGAL
jgi:hypothetical protein